MTKSFDIWNVASPNRPLPSFFKLWPLGLRVCQFFIGSSLKKKIWNFKAQCFNIWHVAPSVSLALHTTNQWRFHHRAWCHISIYHWSVISAEPLFVRSGRSPCFTLLFSMEVKRVLPPLLTYRSSAEITDQWSDGSVVSSHMMKSPLICCVQGWGYRRWQLLYPLSVLDGMDTSSDLHPISSLSPIWRFYVQEPDGDQERHGQIVLGLTWILAALVASIHETTPWKSGIRSISCLLPTQATGTAAKVRIKSSQLIVLLSSPVIEYSLVVVIVVHFEHGLECLNACTLLFRVSTESFISYIFMLYILIHSVLAVEFVVVLWNRFTIYVHCTS